MLHRVPEVPVWERCGSLGVLKTSIPPLQRFNEFGPKIFGAAFHRQFLIAYPSLPDDPPIAPC